LTLLLSLQLHPASRVLRFGLHVLITLWLGLLTAAAIQSHRPAPWTTLKGPSVKSKASSANLMELMEQSVFRKNTALEISEADMNQYLSNIIAGKQSGLSGPYATFERVALDFEPGTCQVCLSWTLPGGHRSTSDLVFTLERKGNEYIIEPRQGHYGRLPLPRGMMATMTPVLQSLCATLHDELRTVFQMNQIRFAQDKLVLDPRMEPAR
jgi:hypothetical protein